MSPLPGLLMQSADLLVRLEHEHSRGDLDAALREAGKLDALTVRIRDALARELYPMPVDGGGA